MIAVLNWLAAEKQEYSEKRFVFPKP